MASHQTYMQDCLAAFKIIDNASLEHLIGAANLELQNRAKKAKEDTMQQIRELAAQAGLSKQDLLEIASGKGRVERDPKAKYQHPTIAGCTWSGNGKRPKWVVAWMEEHGNIDALKIAA